MLPPDSDLTPADAEDAPELPEFIQVTDVLDLHGFFPEQVPEMLADFIEQAYEIKKYELRIIHGKGKSKLKWIVRRVLESDERVIYLGDAPSDAGGWGATQVVLRPPAVET
ncbi:Smr/MutS family protein [candidate division KSB1 bacterium]|nr:Smr/MutS family protein [candidate division KSB1 bacterium]